MTQRRGQQNKADAETRKQESADKDFVFAFFPRFPWSGGRSYCLANLAPTDCGVRWIDDHANRGGRSLQKIVEQLRSYLTGWLSYYGFAEVVSNLRHVEAWLRHRLRCLIWVQWKTSRRRLAELCKRQRSRILAERTARSSKGPWRLSGGRAANLALPNAYFSKLGLPSLTVKRHA